MLSDQAERQVRGILEAGPSTASSPTEVDARKVHAGYLALMDQGRADALGARPIAPDLAALRTSSRSDLAGLMSREAARVMSWSSAAEGVAIPIVAPTLANTGHADATLPGIALGVGLHSLPMA